MTTATLSLADRLLGWRDRLLASPAFHRLASGFVLTRPVAQRRARQLFDLVAGFVYSQVLAACVHLDLFKRLSAGPMTLAALADHRVRIRIRGGAESLNLATAAAVCLYESAFALRASGAAAQQGGELSGRAGSGAPPRRPARSTRTWWQPWRRSHA